MMDRSAHPWTHGHRDRDPYCQRAPAHRRGGDRPWPGEGIERSALTASPPPSWHLTMGQSPEVAKEFAKYWDMLHRGGLIEYRIKELCRIQIA